MPRPPAQPNASRAQTVHRLAGELGFSLLGIAPACASEHGQFVRQWLAQGHHGQMDYLTHSLDERLDPTKLVPGAKAVICVADRYAVDEFQISDFRFQIEEKQATLEQPQAGGRPQIKNQNSEIRNSPLGLIARYAWGDDYHRVIKKRLHALADQLREAWPDETFRTAVDTAPTLEREHAQRAGLGWIGKHTLLIHPQLGSWLLLGEIITTLAIEPSTFTAGPVTDHCGSCTRCIDACPTQCITPYQLDAGRCVSYLTIEHHGPIDPAMHEAMGSWIAGCDVCQQVCPFNYKSHQNAHASDVRVNETHHEAYTPRPPAPGIDLLQLLQWTEQDRQRAFVRSALKRIKLDQLKRNALIAATNHLQKHDNPALRERISTLANDATEPTLVRDTAKACLQRLSNSLTP